MKEFRYSMFYYIFVVIVLISVLGGMLLVSGIIYKFVLLSLIPFGIYGLIKDKDSYFSVDEEKLAWNKKNHKKEIYWKDVRYISAPHSNKFMISQILIYVGEIDNLLITWWIGDYKKLVYFAYEKCEGNNGIIIDNQVIKLIKGKL